MLSDQITVTINNYYTFAAMTCEILLRLSPTYPLCITCVSPVFVDPLCSSITCVRLSPVHHLPIPCVSPVFAGYLCSSIPCVSPSP